MTQPQRKSIYDDPTPRTPSTTEPPSQLEELLRSTRHSVTASFASTRTQVDSVVNEVMKVEAGVRNSIASVAAPGEKLLPGALYITIFGFAGSILSKNRNVLLRMSLPAALSLGSFAYLYPGTSVNILKRANLDAITAIPRNIFERFSPPKKD